MSKMSWLHWINKEYPTTVAFLSEARRLGIILPVTLLEIEGLNWNDDIYLLHKLQGNKHPSVFCRLPVKRIYGISRDAAERIRERLDNTQKNAGGDFVRWFNADYLEGGTWTVEATLQEVIAVLDAFWKDNPYDISRLGIGCYQEDVETMPLPWPRLQDIKHQRGFRLFDGDRFVRDVDQVKKSNHPVIRLSGEYQTEDYSVTSYPCGDIQWAEDYQDLPKRVAQKQLEMKF